MPPNADRAEDVRALTLDELPIGRTVPGDVRDESGQVLIPAGAAVEPRHLETLREGDTAVYGGPGWPPVADGPADVPADGGSPGSGAELPASEVLEALRRRYKPKGKPRVRRYQRHSWRVTLTVEIEEANHEGMRRRRAEVTTNDLSAGGISFSINQFIHPNTIVRVWFATLPNKPCLSGIVRSCTHVSGTLHRVGVEFVQVEQVSKAKQFGAKPGNSRR